MLRYPRFNHRGSTHIERKWNFTTTPSYHRPPFIRTLYFNRLGSFHFLSPSNTQLKFLSIKPAFLFCVQVKSWWWCDDNSLFQHSDHTANRKLIEFFFLKSSVVFVFVTLPMYIVFSQCAVGPHLWRPRERCSFPIKFSITSTDRPRKVSYLVNLTHHRIQLPTHCIWQQSTPVSYLNEFYNSVWWTFVKCKIQIKSITRPKQRIIGPLNLQVSRSLEYDA